MGECLTGSQEVGGSIPPSSTRSSPLIAGSHPGQCRRAGRFAAAILCGTLCSNPPTLIASPDPPVPAPTAPDGGTPGESAPALQLRDLDGVESSLADYRGSIVVLNFWATWCLPCRLETPYFSWAQAEYGRRGLQVIGISIDAAEDVEKVAKFARRRKLAYSIWLGGTQDQMERMGLGPGIPSTAFISRDGRIAARVEGLMKKPELKRRIEELIGPERAAER